MRMVLRVSLAAGVGALALGFAGFQGAKAADMYAPQGQYQEQYQGQYQAPPQPQYQPPPQAYGPPPVEQGYGYPPPPAYGYPPPVAYYAPPPAYVVPGAYYGRGPYAYGPRFAYGYGYGYGHWGYGRRHW